MWPNLSRLILHVVVSIHSHRTSRCPPIVAPTPDIPNDAAAVNGAVPAAAAAALANRTACGPMSVAPAPGAAEPAWFGNDQAAEPA